MSIQDLFEKKAKRGIKFFYNNLIRNDSVPAGQEKWSTNLSDNNLPWSKIYSLNKWANPDTRTRSFQFKLLHRILPTNAFLKAIRVINDDRCSICKNEKETLEHVFIYCPFTRHFWDNLESYLTQKLHYNVKFTTSERLFGVLRGSKALNHITTLTTKHIYFSLVGDTGSHGWSEHIFVESSLEILKVYIYHKSLFPIPKVVRISQN